MRSALEDKLKSDFPDLFKEECVPAIGDGWEPLLRRLCDAIHDDRTLRFTQIKEKFGGLRVYMNRYKGITQEIRYVQEQSFRTCEECGAGGRMAITGSGWYFTTCQECLDMMNANDAGGAWVSTLEVESDEEGDA